MIERFSPVRVRFAPSPTGHLHLGGARTALFNYLIARQTGGQFILRIEDTDRKRYDPQSETEFYQTLKWLGIHWDEGPDVGGPFGPYRQSERKAIYQEYAHQLIDKGLAYYCFCTSQHLDRVRQEQMLRKEILRYDGACRRLDPRDAEIRVASGDPHVIRFKTPKEGSTTVRDLIRGDITVSNHTLDDFILVKSDGLAVYHLAAMVDDHLMKISHVIRGSEWLSTLPLHGLIRRSFGWEEPIWVHLSVFLKPSGKGKMNKRDVADLGKEGHSIFIKDLDELGYIHEAVNNWIALMGWSYDDHTEVFSLQDLVEKFNLDKLNPAPAAINFTKLDYFNGLHIRALSQDDLAARLIPFFERAGLAVDKDRLTKIVPIIRERIAGLDEAPEMAGFFFRESVEPDPQDLVGKGMSAPQVVHVLREARQVLARLPELTAELSEPVMRGLLVSLRLTAGQVFGVLRVAVTGQKVSPPLFESMAIIGKEKVFARIDHAIELVN